MAPCGNLCFFSILRALRNKIAKMFPSKSWILSCNRFYRTAACDAALWVLNSWSAILGGRRCSVRNLLAEQTFISCRIWKWLFLSVLFFSKLKSWLLAETSSILAQVVVHSILLMGSSQMMAQTCFFPHVYENTLARLICWGKERTQACLWSFFVMISIENNLASGVCNESKPEAKKAASSVSVVFAETKSLTA